MTNRGRVAQHRERRAALEAQHSDGLITEAEFRLECLNLDAEFHGEHWDQDRWHRHIEATESAMAEVEAESLATARALSAGAFAYLFAAEADSGLSLI